MVYGRLFTSVSYSDGHLVFPRLLKEKVLFYTFFVPLWFLSFRCKNNTKSFLYMSNDNLSHSENMLEQQNCSFFNSTVEFHSENL